MISHCDFKAFVLFCVQKTAPFTHFTHHQSAHSTKLLQQKCKNAVSFSRRMTKNLKGTNGICCIIALLSW